MKKILGTFLGVVILIGIYLYITVTPLKQVKADIIVPTLTPTPFVSAEVRRVMFSGPDWDYQNELPNTPTPSQETPTSTPTPTVLDTPQPAQQIYQCVCEGGVCNKL